MTAGATPQRGDRVVFEGLPSRIVELTGDKVEFVSDLTYAREDKSEAPRFRTVANRADLLWSTRLDAWYVWGRVLSKGRGGTGVDQRKVIAALRDIGIIPSRPGRLPQQVPTAGEQHGLFCDLFAGGMEWAQELSSLRTGDGLSAEAKDCCKAHGVGFRTKRLNHGFADPGDGDPGAPEGAV